MPELLHLVGERTAGLPAPEVEAARSTIIRQCRVIAKLRGAVTNRDEQVELATAAVQRAEERCDLLTRSFQAATEKSPPTTASAHREVLLDDTMANTRLQEAREGWENTQRVLLNECSRARAAETSANELRQSHTRQCGFSMMEPSMTALFCFWGKT